MRNASQADLTSSTSATLGLEALPFALLLGMLDDPETGIALFDAQLRVLHLTSQVPRLLELPEGGPAAIAGQSVLDLLARSGLDPASVETAQRVVHAFAGDNAPVSMVLQSRVRSRSIRLRLRNVTPGYRLASFAEAAAEAGMAAQHAIGSGQWVDSLATNLLQEHAAVTAIAVGEGQRMEERRASEERLTAALENCQIGAWALSFPGKTANRTLAHDRIFGYSTFLPCWTYEMFLEHVLPEDRAEVDRSFQEAIAAGANWGFECRIRRVDGAVRWLWAAGGHERDSAGKAIGMSGIVQDITDGRGADESMAASEMRYRRLFETAQDGILILDAESGVVLDVNPFLVTMLGYARELFLGKTICELGFFRHVFANRRNFAELRMKEALRYDDLPLETVHGERIAVEFIGNVHTVNGRKVMQCNIRDISKRKRAERRLAMRNATSRVLADAASLAEATPGILRAICEAEDWEFGSIWEVDGAAAVLRCREIWHSSPFDAAALAQRTREMTFAIGEGLPGRVWAAGEMQLIPDVEKDPGYLRDPMALAAGLRGALAFPVFVGNQVTGVIDFTARAIGQVDGELRETFLAIGRQVGQFVERARAEESLRATQTRLQSTLAAGSIGTWTWDIAHDRLCADDFTARLFGLEPAAAAQGMPMQAYLQGVLKEDQGGVADGLARAMESRCNYDIEYRVAPKEGELRWVQAKGRVEVDATGKAAHFHGAVLDITERKRIEGRFRRLADSNAQGVMFWNLNGRAVEANNAFLEMVGYTREELEAGLVNWAEMTPPEFAKLDERCVAELAAKGVCTPYEKEYFRKDGTRVPVLLGAALFEDSSLDGLSFVIDITGRKQTERALRESEEHFRLLNDLSQATRALSDPKEIMAVTVQMLGKHLRVSRCTYANVEEDGKHFAIVHDYTDGCASAVGRYQLSLFGARVGGAVNSGQSLILRNVDAELLPGEGADALKVMDVKALIVCPLREEGGLRATMAVHQTTPRDWTAAEITIVQDVAERCWATIERRSAEENVHQLNAELEHRVAERTAQLEEANKELEAFSYSVSHDLRAPLRTMDGFSQAVLEDYGWQLPEEGRRRLQTIRASTQRMGALIDDLLNFSRLSQQSLRKRAIDTQQLVRDVLEELAEQREGRQIEIRLGELAACRGDRALVKQVWFNLLANAIKYTRKRERAVVEIGCSREADETVYFVRDNGAGFDMTYANKLFGVFQRLHRAEEYEGTGVGLAIVQRVVHRHGGRIWAEAVLDEGATFNFTLDGKAA